MIENIIGSWIRRPLMEEYILKPGVMPRLKCNLPKSINESNREHTQSSIAISKVLSPEEYDYLI